MDCQGDDVSRKRMKSAYQGLQMEGDGGNVGEGVISKVVANEEMETNIAGSEEMELSISQIHEKMDRFTQMVSELLETVKNLFKELSDEFEDRLIMLHKEQVDKWQDEIKELRLLDGSNEEDNTLLHHARYMLQNPHINSSEKKLMEDVIIQAFLENE